MSDAALPPADLPGDVADEELIFDEPKPVMVLIPVEADAASAEPRRVPRRGRKSKEEAASPEPAPASSMPTASAGADAAPAEEPAGAPAPFPPQGADPAGSKSSPSRLLLATVALALVTSTASLGGLIAVSRTLAHAGVDRTQAAVERAALAGVPQMVAHLDAASARLDAATARLSATPAMAASPVAPPAPVGQAITMTDLHHEIDALKLALGQRQPEGITALNGMTRDGFTEVTTKLDRLEAQVEQMQRGGAKR